MIGSKEASEALAEVNDIIQRVRQSRIYYLNGLIMVLWGVLVFAGNIATWLWPRYGGYIWITVDIAGVVGLFAISVFTYSRMGVRTFDVRMLVTFLLFFAFGYFCSNVLGHLRRASRERSGRFISCCSIRLQASGSATPLSRLVALSPC
jgi:hypothetical protein